MNLFDFNEHSACIYFIGCDEVPLVKIGETSIRRLETRMTALQCGSPVKLILLGVKPTHNKMEERLLHNMFSHLRSHGEWFHLGKEIREYILREAGHDWKTLLPTLPALEG